MAGMAVVAVGCHGGGGAWGGFFGRHRPDNHAALSGADNGVCFWEAFAVAGFVRGERAGAEKVLWLYGNGRASPEIDR